MANPNINGVGKCTFPMRAGAGSNIFKYWIIYHTGIFLPSLSALSLLRAAFPNDSSFPWKTSFGSSFYWWLWPLGFHNAAPSLCVSSLGLIAVFCFFAFTLFCVEFFFVFTSFVFDIESSQKFYKVPKNIQGLLTSLSSQLLIHFQRVGAVSSFLHLIRKFCSNSYNLKLVTPPRREVLSFPVYRGGTWPFCKLGKVAEFFWICMSSPNTEIIIVTRSMVNI